MITHLPLLAITCGFMIAPPDSMIGTPALSIYFVVVVFVFKWYPPPFLEPLKAAVLIL